MSGSIFPTLSSLRRRLFFGGVWAFGAKVGAGLLYLGVNAVLARLLPPAELGIYFLAYSIVALGASVGELGLGRAANRLVAESLGLRAATHCRAVVRRILQLGVVGALLSGGVYAAIGGLTGRHLHDSPALAAITIPVALWIGFTVLQRVLTEIFRGLHEIRLASLFGRTADAFTTAAILLPILLVLGWHGTANLMSVCLASVGATFVTVVAAAHLLRLQLRPLTVATDAVPLKSQSAPAASDARRILAVSLPMLVTNLSAFALSYQLDLWLLGLFHPEEEVALYGAAARLIFIIAAPVMIINAVVPPVIAELDAQGRKPMLERVLRSASSVGSLSAVAVLGVFVVAGGPLLGLLFGDYYKAAIVILLLLSLGQVTSVLSGSCAMTLMMTGNERTMMRISLLITVIAIVSGLLAARFLGATGLAAVSAGRSVLQNLIMIVAVQRLVGVRTYVDPTFRAVFRLLKEPVVRRSRN